MNKKNILIVFLVLLVLIEIFLIKPHHPEFFWQKIKGFPVLLGLAGGILLMIFAKSLGRFFLYRSEDYYTKAGEDNSK